MDNSVVIEYNNTENLQRLEVMLQSDEEHLILTIWPQMI